MEQIFSEAEVILGVDTHLDVHVGVVIDQVGRVQGTHSIPTNALGYEELLGWVQQFGSLKRAGIEGTASYGAGLTRFLEAKGITVIEVNRPNRMRRRSPGKSDPTDAESAARAVLAEDANSVPKAQSGLAEALRMLNVARRSAVKCKTQAVNQLRALLVSAPQSIREAALKVKPEQCIAACMELDCGDEKNPVMASLKTTLRLLARRWSALHGELKELDQHLSRLTKMAAPRLQRHCSSPQATTRRDYATKQPWPPCAASVPYRHLPEKPTVTGSTAEATGRRTIPCGPLPWFECEATHVPANMLPGAPVRACRKRKSSGASSATLFVSCIH
jgi:transposase